MAVGVGVTVGMAVGVGVAVGLGVAVGATVGVGVAVGLGVAVAVGLGVAVDVGFGVAVGLGLGFFPVIVLIGDTLSTGCSAAVSAAAAHRTYHVYVGCEYGKRAWPFTLVFFDIQSANGPVIAAAFCTDTVRDGTAWPLLSLTVQVIIE